MSAVYPMCWVHTVTVYHRVADSDGNVIWVRRYYDSCFWNVKSSSGRSGGYSNASEVIVCRFKLPVSDIAVGDIVVKGKATDSIDEFYTGKRSTDILTKYAPNCFCIDTLHDNSDSSYPIPHIYTAGATA